MPLRTLGFAALAVSTLFLNAHLARAEGFGLSETKDELKLKYVVAVMDQGAGRVTLTLTIADEGRLAPLARGVDLSVPSKDGTRPAELAVKLTAKKIDGKKVFTVQLAREQAERAEIYLNTDTLDGKREPLTWYFFKFPVAEYLKDSGPKEK